MGEATPGTTQLVGDTRPIPDPTSLTTEQLHREIGQLAALMETKMQGLESMTAERFASVRTQLDLVERQRVEQKSDTKAAVDAALTAQKEAVKEQTTASERAIAKSEASTTKQLEQLNVTFTTAIKGVTDVVGDVKDRVSKIESVRQGGKETLTGLYALVGVVAVVFAILGTLAASGAFA